MKRRSQRFYLLVLLFFLSAPLLLAHAHGEPVQGIPHIGVLVPLIRDSPTEEGLRDGLRSLGYVEGKNISVEWGRWKASGLDINLKASELADAGVEIVVATGSPAVRAALQTGRVPVVFISGDPVGAGFAESLSRPGGSATGVSMLTTKLNEKSVELFHQIFPRMHRILYLRSPSNPLAEPALQEVSTTAKALGLQVVTLDARDADELNATMRAIRARATDGLFVSPELFFLAHKATITATVRRARLAAMFTLKEYHQDGALMSYGASLKDAMGRVAVYVDKILRGAKPADLPIEQLSKYELIINLRIARELGIKVPQELLLRADEVIR